ncbi:MAG TPA: hypothetical protein VHK90_13910, partial [Thermoanaerobaculia bacterium]|nr:hypothetical protein [Thermoanaerobaculia bacterium]
AALYLWRLRQAFRGGVRMVVMAIAPAVTIVGGAVLLIASTVSLRDYVFFTFTYNLILFDSFGTQFAERMPPFLYCAPAFKGAWPAVVMPAAAAILLVPPIRRRVPELDARAYAVVFALGVAALLDIRFVFPYPNLWSQYYVMWSFAAAALYGMTAAVVLRALARGMPRVEAAVQIVVALAIVFEVQRMLPRDSGDPRSWVDRSYIQERLRPGETVWLSPPVHPIDAFNASYYWFAFADLVPASLRYVAKHPEQTYLPKAREEDLPMCSAARGLEPNLRFVSGHAAMSQLPLVRHCLDRLIASGRAVETPIDDVWELRSAPE